VIRPPSADERLLPAPTRTTGRVRRRRWPGVLAVAVALLLVASVTGVLPVRIMRVGSDSMSPTIATGDLVLVTRSDGDVERRDVVVVDHPDTGALLVKRAVAIGGDRLAIEDGVLVVNGEPVCEPDIDPARLDGVFFGPVTVARGEVFLLGDDRDSSIDSRAFGAVPADEVTGLVGSRLWPSPGALPDELC
jgi:signal peptidase I